MAVIRRRERARSGWRPTGPVPLAAWGRSLFAPRDDFPTDGVHVGGIQLMRGPDGTLIGIVDEEPEQVKDEAP